MSLEQIKQASEKLVQSVAKKRLTGSFSERHPMLGKKVKCPFCGQRFFSNDPNAAHCNARYSVVNDALFSKAVVKGRRKKSHTHKNGQPHPGNANLVHQRILEFQRDEDYFPYLAAAKTLESLIKQDGWALYLMPALDRVRQFRDNTLIGRAVKEMQYSKPLTGPMDLMMFAQAYTFWLDKQQRRESWNREKVARRKNR